ncbi:MAG: hypothetical protein GY932_13465 [Arcobacter sp.]|nr:hypothetical protein [Arcobacter sp.]
MPIKKFNSFEEASKALWVLDPQDDYYKKLKDLYNFWGKISHRKCTKGIQKIKSYNDLLKLQQWE